MKAQRGYNLIEFLIAMTLGLIVVGSAVGIYIGSIRGSSDTAKSARLSHDLESVMMLMVNDIRRAGNWGGALVGGNSNNNPFTRVSGDATDLAVRNLAEPAKDTAEGDCILYSYDADGNGADPAVADPVAGSERYGFRLNNGTLNMKLSGAATDPADCSEGTWEENIAGNRIQITGLTFDLSDSECKNVSTGKLCEKGVKTGDQIVETRQVNIALSGRLIDDATVTKTLTHSVKVRNDRVYKQP